MAEEISIVIKYKRFHSNLSSFECYQLRGKNETSKIFPDVQVKKLIALTYFKANWANFNEKCHSSLSSLAMKTCNPYWQKNKKVKKY